MSIINPNYPPQWPDPYTKPKPQKIITTVINNSPSKNKADQFKPKKPGKDTAHTIFVLDDSGSMNWNADETGKAFNEFLVSQRKSEVPTVLSLYKFSGSNVELVYSAVPANHVEELTEKTYDPKGHSTNLLDAFGKVMFDVNDMISAVSKKKNRSSVQVVVLTDGDENSSYKFTNSEIGSMVGKAEKKNWTFMFLGANIDAFSVGARMGFNKSNTLQYSTNNMSKSMLAAGRMSNDLKMATKSGMSSSIAYASTEFTDEEREQANE